MKILFSALLLSTLCLIPAEGEGAFRRRVVVAPVRVVNASVNNVAQVQNTGSGNVAVNQAGRNLKINNAKAKKK